MYVRNDFSFIYDNVLMIFSLGVIRSSPFERSTRMLTKSCYPVCCPTKTGVPGISATDCVTQLCLFYITKMCMLILFFVSIIIFYMIYLNFLVCHIRIFTHTYMHMRMIMSLPYYSFLLVRLDIVMLSVLFHKSFE